MTKRETARLAKGSPTKAARAAVLLNAGNPGHIARFKEIDVAGRGIGITPQSVAVRSSGDFESAVRAAVEGRADVVNVADALFSTHRARIVDLATKNRLPAMYDRDDFVEAGGLMSHGVDLDDIYLRVATYVDKILKGAKGRRSPGGAVDEIRASDQSQNSEADRPNNFAQRARAGR